MQFDGNIGRRLDELILHDSGAIDDATNSAY
jgi:hypothetical protein